MGDLRTDQVELTKERILDAAVEIIARDITELSIQEVVRLSGVSRPTVYRHFANVRAIVDAVGARYREQIGIDAVAQAKSLDEVLEAGRAVWARNSDEDERIRAVVAAIQAVQPPVPERIELVRSIVAAHGRGLDDEEREHTARILTILFSSAARNAFRTLLGIEHDEASDSVAWVARKLLEGDCRHARPSRPSHE
ncbi:MAG: helix-turn-helix domain-containing protein [Polyangiaceae bacterium]